MALLTLGLSGCGGDSQSGFNWVGNDDEVVSDLTTDDDDDDGDDDDDDDDDAGDDDDDDDKGGDDSKGQDDGGDDDSAGSDDDCHDGTVPYPAATSQQLATYGGHFPGYDSAYSFPLPPALLSQEDIDRSNDEVLVFHDDHLEPLGFVREVFTDVDCISGVCDAIRVTYLFAADFSCTDVFDTPGGSHPLKKFADPGGYIRFNTDDMDLLRSFVVSPPQAILDAPTTDSLVQGTHSTAATLPQYISAVIRGGAFTTWMVIQYSVSTRTLLESQAGAFDLGCSP